jgi:DNA-binding transcriptional ArsR family regulator
VTHGAISMEAADEAARFARALGHPLRVRLLAGLATIGPGSPTMFSGRFGDTSVGDCHYHLKALRTAGLADLSHSRPVRGVTERVYRLAPRSEWQGAAGHLLEALDVLLPAPSIDELLGHRTS